MLSYSGWSLWGSMAYVLKDQGVNMALNIFFGPVVNAARGITYQTCPFGATCRWRWMRRR